MPPVEVVKKRLVVVAEVVVERSKNAPPVTSKRELVVVAVPPITKPMFVPPFGKRAIRFVEVANFELAPLLIGQVVLQTSASKQSVANEPLVTDKFVVVAFVVVELVAVNPFTVMSFATSEVIEATTALNLLAKKFVEVALSMTPSSAVKSLSAVSPLTPNEPNEPFLAITELPDVILPLTERFLLTERLSFIVTKPSKYAGPRTFNI